MGQRRRKGGVEWIREERGEGKRCMLQVSALFWLSPAPGLFNLSCFLIKLCS